MATTANRLTQAVEDQHAYAALPGVSEADLIARLGLYEDVLARLCADYDDATEQIGRLRDESKVRTVTYRQLVSSRITMKEMLGRFEAVGL